MFIDKSEQSSKEYKQMNKIWNSGYSIVPDKCFVLILNWSCLGSRRLGKLASKRNPARSLNSLRAG